MSVKRPSAREVADGRPRRAAVSSLGPGGTNRASDLEEALPAAEAPVEASERPGAAAVDGAVGDFGDQERLTAQAGRLLFTQANPG